MIAVLAAPSNLGLRPPQRGSVPGTAKAPEALRGAGLIERLKAIDAGVVLPGRYVDDDETRAPGHVRNEDAMVDFSRRLAARIHDVRAGGGVPLVLGGDCSVLIGAGLAMSNEGAGAGLVHVDGHTDFRHPGNSDECASVAGEDLAAAIGLHWPAIADIDGRGPYFAPERVAHVGCRDDDAHAAELASVIDLIVPASEAMRDGLSRTAQRVTERGYWLQVDVDVLDPAWMPAVDSPDPGGLEPDELIELLHGLAPRAAGISVTVFDPDLDPDGRHGSLLVDILTAGLAQTSRLPG